MVDTVVVVYAYRRPLPSDDEEHRQRDAEVHAGANVSRSAALPDSALLPINVDIASVVTTVCGAWPQILALRSEIATLPQIDMASFDRILELALSLGHTQSLYLAVNGPSPVLPPLGAEAQRTRDVLLGEVKLLDKRGLIDASFAESFRGRPSYKDRVRAAALVNCLRTLAPARRADGPPQKPTQRGARSMTQDRRVKQAPVIAAFDASNLHAARQRVRRGAPRGDVPALETGRRRDCAAHLRPRWRASRGGRRRRQRRSAGRGRWGDAGRWGARDAGPRIEPGMPGRPFIDERDQRWAVRRQRARGSTRPEVRTATVGPRRMVRRPSTRCWRRDLPTNHARLHLTRRACTAVKVSCVLAVLLLGCSVRRREHCVDQRSRIDPIAFPHRPRSRSHVDARWRSAARECGGVRSGGLVRAERATH